MKQLFILFCLLGMLSCAQVPLATTNANNNTYTVHYLFEHEGCKVYRFYDQGRYVYFTNCTGNVSVSDKDSTDTNIQTIIHSSPTHIEK